MTFKRDDGEGSKRGRGRKGTHDGIGATSRLRIELVRFIVADCVTRVTLGHNGPPVSLAAGQSASSARSVHVRRGSPSHPPGPSSIYPVSWIFNARVPIIRDRPRPTESLAPDLDGDAGEAYS